VRLVPTDRSGRWFIAVIVVMGIVATILAVITASAPVDGGCYRSKGGDHYCQEGRDTWDWPG